ncbi:5-oxoprolinase subunit C family protein [Microbulbifer celer]|uniref:Biotin-dependent carboxyltransferase family protein n=1 Tax=Microbulbifer celer TaxID=435905 RepID=A0ABW3UAQ6_9GAMM|nr:biotin-dependent carboxyltransferase family protein [Microbulbifer celer]UFN56263.1 biotin-dependent carboxyltransferase family protein [Microbulbifer celer]
MSLHIIQPGLQTSIQSVGRPGLMRWGVARGGAADTFAMALGNLLLGNPIAHPGIEVALTGPEIEFTTDVSIAVTGARFDLSHNENAVPNNAVLNMAAGDRLRFGALKSGARAYLALAAEIDLAPVFGSVSTHLISGFGGLHGRSLRTGDHVPLQHCRYVAPRELPPQFRLDYRTRPLIRVVPGCEAGYFSAEALSAFHHGGFAVSPQSNRMGIRLTGEPLATTDLPQLVSSALCPGTVQVPPNGLPIISFVEGQTIGGYPRIAHVISADLHRLGQLQANQRLDFEPVSAHSARRILKEKTQLLHELPAML